MYLWLDQAILTHTLAKYRGPLVTSYAPSGVWRIQARHRQTNQIGHRRPVITINP